MFYTRHSSRIVQFILEIKSSTLLFAFITKAEFDAALSDFNARLTTFEAGINSKIDSQVSSYLDRNGIWNGTTQTVEANWKNGDNFDFQLVSNSSSNVYAIINKVGGTPTSSSWSSYPQMAFSYKSIRPLLTSFSESTKKLVDNVTKSGLVFITFNTRYIIQSDGGDYTNWTQLQTNMHGNSVSSDKRSWYTTWYKSYRGSTTSSITGLDNISATSPNFRGLYYYMCEPSYSSFGNKWWENVSYRPYVDFGTSPSTGTGISMVGYKWWGDNYLVQMTPKLNNDQSTFDWDNAPFGDMFYMGTTQFFVSKGDKIWIRGGLKCNTWLYGSTNYCAAYMGGLFLAVHPTSVVVY